MYLYTYNSKSKGAKALAEAIPATFIHKNIRFGITGPGPIINWGGTTDQFAGIFPYINPPAAVAAVSNKLRFFEVMRGMNYIPRWWTQKDFNEAPYQTTLVARTILNGHSGKGIELFTRSEHDEQPDPFAELYVQYIPKKYEFRVHVFRSEVFDMQQKARRLDVPDDQVNWKIRNHHNGFIYKRLMTAPQAVCEVVQETAINCFNILRNQTALDFGAIDIIWNEAQKKAYVLEINTAPGLEGTTLTRYANVFRGLNA